MYREDEEEHENKIIIVCKDESEWINSETGMPYDGFNMCGIVMITSKNIDHFENCVIVIDDVGNKLKNDIAEHFAGGRHDDIRMIVMGHKPAQIVNTARMSCDTIYLTTYNGADLLKNYNEVHKCKHDSHGIINELSRNLYNCKDKTTEALRDGLIK